MVGQRPLEPLIVVRIHAGEPTLLQSVTYGLDKVRCTRGGTKTGVIIRLCLLLFTADTPSTARFTSFVSRPTRRNISRAATARSGFREAPTKSDIPARRLGCATGRRRK